MGLSGLPDDVFIRVLVLLAQARDGRVTQAEEIEAIRALAVHEADELDALAREGGILRKARSATIAASAADACRRIQDVLNLLDAGRVEDAHELYVDALGKAARS